jgi:hypothetical protein
MTKPRVLIISYYWPPSGGAGVQRWVKFVKYLRDFGWEPVVYVPENPEYPSLDATFANDLPEELEVIKRPIREPYNIYRKLTGKGNEPINAGFITENAKKGWKDALAIRLRGNFLIPDPRCFWIRPSVRFLSDYIRNHPVQALVTTGPPHSMHRIGYGLKKIFPDLPWLADFRDPWTNIDFYHELGLTRVADAIHHRMERQVVQLADAVVVVSGGMMQEFKVLKPKRLVMIPNGFDTADVEHTSVQPDQQFTVSHIGTMNAARNPEVVWEAIRQLCDENIFFKKDLKIQLIGKVDFSVLESIKKFGLDDKTEKTDYLPHTEAIQRQQSSQVLLLIINNTPNAKGILTGKFFEYIASGRPVLGVGPSDGDAALVLNDTRAGKMVDYDDVDSAKQILLQWYTLYQEKRLQVETSDVAKYSRRSLTGSLATLLNELQYKSKE